MPWVQVEGGEQKGLEIAGPILCDMCRAELDKTKPMYDAVTMKGPWGYLCPSCFKKWGRGLGIGLGQKYEYTEDTDSNLPANR